VVDAVTLKVIEQIPLRIRARATARILPWPRVGPQQRPAAGGRGRHQRRRVVNLTTIRWTRTCPRDGFRQRSRWTAAASSWQCQRARHGPTPPAPLRSSTVFRASAAPNADRLRHAPAAPHADVTQRVYTLGGFLPRKLEPPALPAAIRHVVVIVKENRPSTRSSAPPTGLQRRGQRRPRSGPPGAPAGLWHEAGSLKARAVKSAYTSRQPPGAGRALRMSDNFTPIPRSAWMAIHWLVGSYPNAWTESSMMPLRGQKDFRFRPPRPPPLQRDFELQPAPEEQLEAGALWHHLDRHGISFRNFARASNWLASRGTGEMRPARATGQRAHADPLPQHLARLPAVQHEHPGSVPATQLIAELERLYNQPAADLPRFIYIHLPTTHG